MTAMRHRGGAGAPAWMRSWRRGDAGMDGAAGRPRERAVRGPPAWPACTPSDTQRRLYGRCPDRLPAVGATLLARTVQGGDARCSGHRMPGQPGGVRRVLVVLETLGAHAVDGGQRIDGDAAGDLAG